MTKTLIFPDLQVNIRFSCGFHVLDQIPRSLYRRDRVHSSVEYSDWNIQLCEPPWIIKFYCNVFQELRCINSLPRNVDCMAYLKEWKGESRMMPSTLPSPSVWDSTTA